jgi:hypothetical protein
MTPLRWILVAACAAAFGVAGPAAAALTHHGHHANHRAKHRSTRASATLPVERIESIMQLQGSDINGVLSLGVDRTDIDNVTLHGVPIDPSFEINGEFDFQPLGNGQALENGDLPVKPDEINPVIDAIVSHGLTFQAEHQHMYDFSPMVWFIHIRGKGNAVQLAEGLHAVLKATSTPLPQAPPKDPKTPFDAGRLQSILHGYDAEVSDNGIVTVYVARRNPVFIDGVRVNPATNIATNVAFEPLNSSGSRAAVVPDYGMVAGEINPVMAFARSRGWDIGCLYNQETGEHPQLYFSHQFKTGDPYALAAEVRAALDRMNSQ